MRLERFRGPDFASVSREIETRLGEDALIVATRTLRGGEAGGRSSGVELTAVAGDELERFKRRLEPQSLAQRLAVAQRTKRPFVVALVGPTGAGKTTTVAKLATNAASAFGRRSVGLLTLDTYRVGALEQLSQYAELAGLPLEVAYEAPEIRPALQRLRQCEVVIVDTPGRSPKFDTTEKGRAWQRLLASVAPDEVHFVVPAGMREDVAVAALRALEDDLAPTHALYTKLDEVPRESGLAELAAAIDLPARWVTDGQGIPDDLRAAAARIVASLGVPSTREAVA